MGVSRTKYPTFFQVSAGRLVSATGGTSVTEYGGYRYHSFTTTSLSSLNLKVGGTVEYLIIAGGGGGNGAGGGAGGYLSGTVNLASTIYDIYVGSGGQAGNQNSSPTITGTNGDNSYFKHPTNTSILNLVATGGGAGAISGGVGQNGGSGGGGNLGGGAAGTGIAGQGYAGGTGSGQCFSGGGGAGGLGGNATTYKGGAPGLGLYNSITGSSVGRAGGGGGGGDTANSSNSDASSFGGGMGSATAATPGGSGTANTGSGGGGSPWRSTSQTAGAGGSGIVIIRYTM